MMEFIQKEYLQNIATSILFYRLQILMKLMLFQFMLSSSSSSEEGRTGVPFILSFLSLFGHLVIFCHNYDSTFGDLTAFFSSLDKKLFGKAVSSLVSVCTTEILDFLNVEYKMLNTVSRKIQKCNFINLLKIFMFISE